MKKNLVCLVALMSVQAGFAAEKPAVVDTQRIDPFAEFQAWYDRAKAQHDAEYQKFREEKELPWQELEKKAKAEAKNAPKEQQKEVEKKLLAELPNKPHYRGTQSPAKCVILPAFEQQVSDLFVPLQNQWEKDYGDFRRAVQEWEKAGKAGPRPVEPKRVNRRDYVNQVLKASGTNGMEQAIGARNIRHGVSGMTFELTFKTAGAYRLWFRHWQAKGVSARLAVRLQSETTETVRYQHVDPVADFNVAPHAKGRRFRDDENKSTGFVWSSIEVNVEHPGRYFGEIANFNFDTPRNADVGTRVFAVNDIWISNDPAFDPARRAPTATDVKTPSAVVQPTAEGFVYARHHAPHVSLNTSVMDTQKRLALMFQECYQDWSDDVNRVNLGGTDGMGNGNELAEDAVRVGSTIQCNADCWDDSPRIKALRRKYPFDGNKPIGPGNLPVGRQATWEEGLNDGKGGVKYNGRFSDAFEEYRAARLEGCEAAVKKILADPLRNEALGMWWTAWEQCGTYDYGMTSCENFRAYLKELYGSLAELNRQWHTDYASFDDIFPARWGQAMGKNAFADEPDPDIRDLKKRQAMANFIDFRDFCSKSYAKNIAVKTQAIVKHDPQKRHISSNLSCNNLSSVLWMRWRPLSFEDTARITMKGSDMIGYDNYGTDDLNGANYELFDAFGDGKLRPMIREGSIHACSPYLMARSQFGLFAKGMRGMSCFCMNEHGLGELTKFGMMNMKDDGAPRPKLAAISDNFRAFNQVGRLLTETSRERAVKPVAIYYSSICNVLQEKPYASIFDCGPDNFFRVYELLHANGYAVTFVTDTHFREHPEWIDTLQAVFFVDATYIPKDVQAKAMEYVEKGGHVFADAQSGSCDGHGFPCKEFTEWLGVQPVQQKKFNENDAAAKLAFGYSAYSFDVIQRDELYKTACELKDAVSGPQHPIAKAAGKLMFSIMGYQQVKNVAGETILCENGGSPACVIRNHGKGTSTYFAGYLGTAFGAGCTQYEWRDKHADDSPYRFLDAYLGYVGAKKIAVTDLGGDAKYYARVESPLTDARGNAFLGLVSQNPSALGSFRAKYAMPKGFRAPKMVLAGENGSRRLVRVPFAWNEKSREFAFRLPQLRTWGMVLALNDCEPFLSVEPVDPKRDAYELCDLRPGETLAFRVKVFNPSPKRLAAGEIVLRLPDGWFYDRETAKVADVEPYGESAEAVFSVKAPSVNCARRLRPVNFVFRNAALASDPAVEMVWFQKAPQNAAPVDFGLE